MSRNKPKPTLEDIAELSGVSISTVSRVINQSGPVSREYEIRVREAMKELGKEKTRPDFIALITMEVLDPALATVITGAQKEADKLGIRLVIINVDHSLGSQGQGLELLKYFSFDGIILLDNNIKLNTLLKQGNYRDVPIAMLHHTVSSPHIHCIDMDRENGMYQATKYLLSLNHKDIAYLSGLPEWEGSKARLRGIQRALSEAGLTLAPQFHCTCLPTIEDGFRVASTLLSLPIEKRPTAILAFNDLMAIGVIHAIRTFGLSVPNDISVVGFDNIYVSFHTNPPLTTVVFPAYQMGQLAVQRIYNSLHGEKDQGGLMLLECPLVVRESTGPCRI